MQKVSIIVPRRHHHTIFLQTHIQMWIFLKTPPPPPHLLANAHVKSFNHSPKTPPPHYLFANTHLNVDFFENTTTSTPSFGKFTCKKFQS
jgi:hypothetical protein